MDTSALLIGTVILVESHGVAADVIRAGSDLAGVDGVYNHVAVMHHYDENGTPWGIEGRPGGVGWVDLTAYLAHPTCVTNHRQVEADPVKGHAAARAMEGILGTPYAWLDGIARDAARAVAHLWVPGEQWGNVVPGHVVCSSAADWSYEHVGLESPKPDKCCMPNDWYHFILERGFAA